MNINENRCLEVTRNPITRLAQSCVFTLSRSLILTPNIYSSLVLVSSLKMVLDEIENSKNKKTFFSNKKIFEEFKRSAVPSKYCICEWTNIDVIRTSSGELKVWLQIEAISVYLSIEEVEKIVYEAKNSALDSLIVA